MRSVVILDFFQLVQYPGAVGTCLCGTLAKGLLSSRCGLPLLTCFLLVFSKYYFMRSFIFGLS